MGILSPARRSFIHHFFNSFIHYFNDNNNNNHHYHHRHHHDSIKRDQKSVWLKGAIKINKN